MDLRTVLRLSRSMQFEGKHPTITLKIWVCRKDWEVSAQSNRTYDRVHHSHRNSVGTASVAGRCCRLIIGNIKCFVGKSAQNCPQFLKLALMLNARQQLLSH